MSVEFDERGWASGARTAVAGRDGARNSGRTGWITKLAICNPGFRVMKRACGVSDAGWECSAVVCAMVDVSE